jgi:hypothetical protein
VVQEKGDRIEKEAVFTASFSVVILRSYDK